MQVLIFELSILLDLSYNKISHQQFEVGLPRSSGTNLFLKAMRSHGWLAKVILIGKVWVVFTPKVIGVGNRVAYLITVIIINSILAVPHVVITWQAVTM